MSTENRSINPRRTKQVLIDEGYWHILKIKAAKERTTIKELLEGHLSEVLEVNHDS